VKGQVPVSKRFNRGDHDQPKEAVSPGELSILTKPEKPELHIEPTPAGSTGRRLAYAKWLTSGEHPLTARVLVNRFWLLHMGRGIVNTPGDFGHQGERPTHPELLDWLAVELMESGWDVKRLLRLIVTSETYRQDSAGTGTGGDKVDDPDNRLLARGPRFRLPAWMIRDAALQASGLLNPALGGPPVRPYQPEGVWEEIFMGRFTYVPSEGAAQHRRTLYAFWRRSSAPTFLFDSAQRRVCEVAMGRTNTPLQALTLMNDQSLREAAEEVAMIVTREPGTVRQRIDAILVKLLSRTGTAQELAVLEREHQRALAYYEQEAAAAAAYFSRSVSGANRAELCAFTLVASLILNLDEAITHE
jgi:hypothetical protein